jgi:hypothetical protein
MTLATALILGFLFHLIGDYLLQNDWMANQKTKAFLPAAIHASLYSLLFLFITEPSWWMLLIGSHFLIDRYRLAIYWIKLVNWNWKSKNFGFDDNKPAWMSVWLMIIIDNVWHLVINSFCIYLSFQ